MHCVACSAYLCCVCPAGTFIGAGSFGKVFKGRWNGMDVAVKVIEHSGSSAEAVQQEMEMMMSFQHKNIVRWVCLTEDCTASSWVYCQYIQHVRQHMLCGRA